MFPSDPASPHGPPVADFNGLAKSIHQTCREHGFYDREHVQVTYGDTEALNPSLAQEKLCLIHSEVSETLDALRSGDFAHECEEVADIVIRVFDYASWRGIDVDRAVYDKMRANAGRPRLHGRKF